MKIEGRIDKKKKRASRKNKLLIAELEEAIRSNQYKRPKNEMAPFWAPQPNKKVLNTTSTIVSGELP